MENMLENYFLTGVGYMLAIILLILLSPIILYKFIKTKIEDKNYKKTKKIIKGAEPFFHKRGKIGALLVHGFTSTPNEVGFLGDFLEKKNITVYAPLLPGHGTSPDDLIRTSPSDWIESAENAYKELKKYCDEIFIMGNSVGGNIAIILEQKYNPTGLVLLGTPISFRNERIVKILMPSIPIIKYIKKYYTKRYLDDYPLIKKIKIHYSSGPIGKIRDAYKLTKKTYKLLNKVKTPTLVMQSETDYQFEKKNSKKIYKRLGSELKELHFIKDSYHVFIMDKNKEEAFKHIYKFIQDVLKKKSI